MTAALVIPFRDRGIDPYRPQNLQFVTDWWDRHDVQPVIITNDGRTGDLPFNRSASYNLAFSQHPDVNVFAFVESDVFCDPQQISEGIETARQRPGLVVGFSKFLEIDEQDSIRVRGGTIAHDEASVTQIRGDYGSNGAINIISRETYNLVGGYDETFSSAWWDDSAMIRAFEICCGPTRYIDGPAYHLFHASGGRAGAVTTEADRAATEANRQRYQKYLAAQTPAQIRELTAGA